MRTCHYPYHEGRISNNENNRIQRDTRGFTGCMALNFIIHRGNYLRHENAMNMYLKFYIM